MGWPKKESLQWQIGSVDFDSFVIIYIIYIQFFLILRFKILKLCNIYFYVCFILEKYCFVFYFCPTLYFCALTKHRPRFNWSIKIYGLKEPLNSIEVVEDSSIIIDVGLVTTYVYACVRVFIQSISDSYYSRFISKLKLHLWLLDRLKWNLM